ncbi:FMN-binding negative transcriptional regulator [Sinisalibacter aestuarii]|uniref:Transcriptional regulator n=1 Tax=Sinisalibacter aestuarii TaxID=2949426 RepID=A0ABQ5LNQ9_9RHOB|nr:FMN-binding negative transcriptional regulator [Sinisalibacter aestuarii]GKY86589.1 transcriptional regulator [Sinisalibacter aestuarii]
MHPNPVFRSRPPAANIDFARERGFGVVSVNGNIGPLAVHVPFVLSDDGETVLMHLMRSNPLMSVLSQPLPALLTVSGPDGYVSPDWYGVPDQVPTWNYVAVQLRGHLERLPDERLEDVLDTLTERFEAPLASKTPWRAEKMTPDLRSRMMRAIVPVRLVIEEVSGTWKLSQNKPEAVRLAAADAVGGGQGQELDALSALMRHLPEDPPMDVDRSDEQT